MPSLSVVVPFYKDYAYVKQAVHSVLSENLRDCEVIIVNDNPGEGTSAFLAGCGFPANVRVIAHETNRGLSAARNTGVEAATGDYIAYLDADDFYLPGGLTRQLDWAHESDADVCRAMTVWREQRGGRQPSHRVLGRDMRFFRKNRKGVRLADMPELQFIISSWQSIYRRDFLEQTGIRFDEAQRKFEDRLYVVETAFSGANFALIDQPTRVWRRRSNSITTSLKSDADLRMLASAIHKYTNAAERAVGEGRVAPIHLEREVALALHRLVLEEIEIIDTAVAGNEIGLEIRSLLTETLSRTEPNPEIYSDIIMSQMQRFGSKDKLGRRIEQEHAIAVWEMVCAGRWDDVAELRRNLEVAPVGAIKSQQPLAAPAIVEGAPVHSDVELILHIGLHKTGTTHLQRQFLRHRDRFQEEGLLFPKSGFTDQEGVALKADATPGHQGFMQALHSNKSRFMEALDEEMLASGCKRVFLSCENLSLPYRSGEDRRRMLARADALLHAYPNRRVVAVIRRPDHFVESMFRERVTSKDIRETRNILEFLNEHQGELLDFAGILEPWREFAGDNLTLLDYEKLKGDDYFAGFLRSLDLGVSAPDDGRSRRRPTYPSPHWDEIEMVRLISSCMPSDGRRLDVSRNFLSVAASMRHGKTDRSLLSIDDRLELLAANRTYSEPFFASVGFDFDYDTIQKDIEADRDNWSAPSGLDYQLVEAVFSTIQSTDAAATFQKSKAKKGAVSQAGLLKVHRFHAIRRRLMPLHRRLPAPLKRAASSAFRWLSGMERPAVG